VRKTYAWREHLREAHAARHALRIQNLLTVFRLKCLIDFGLLEKGRARERDDTA
jgi:hypothetical protein